MTAKSLTKSAMYLNILTEQCLLKVLQLKDEKSVFFCIGRSPQH